MSATQRAYVPKWPRPYTGTQNGSARREDRDVNEGLHKQRNPRPPPVQPQYQDVYGSSVYPNRGPGSGFYRSRERSGSRNGGPPPRDSRPSPREGPPPSFSAYRPPYVDNGWQARGRPPRPNWNRTQDRRSLPQNAEDTQPKEHQNPSATNSLHQPARHTRLTPSPRSTPRAPGRNELTRDDKQGTIDELMPKIKQERSPSPVPLDSTPSTQIRTKGSDHIPMRDDCAKSAPNYYEKRKEWKDEIVRQYAAMGKQVTLLIRADGMAVDWELAPSSDTNVIMAERRLERDLLARQGLNHPQPSSSSQHGKAALTAKRPAVERSEAREPSGTAPEARLVDSRSVSPTSSDSSGLFPRKRKRPRQSRTSSPIEGTTTKDGRHQRDEATLAGPTLGVDTGRVFGTQGRRRGDLAETLAGDYYSPAPDDVAESRESPEPDNSILGSKVSKPKSKKRKKPEAPESSTEGIQPQLDEVLSSSTPKPPKEKTLKILPIYEESDEMVAQLFLMQFLRLFDTNKSALKDAYHSDATFSYRISPPAQSGSIVDGTDPRLFAPPSSAPSLVRTDRNTGEPKAQTASHLGHQKTGPTEIIQSFNTMKNWVHGSPTNGPPDSHITRRFVWSISCLPVKALDPTPRKPQRKPSWKTGMILDCHGDLVDPKNSQRCLSFDRTFVLKRNTEPVSKDFWPCVILSDQLTIRARSEHPPRKDDETELF